MSFLKRCQIAQHQAKVNGHRQLIWLRGEPSWCYQQLLQTKLINGAQSLLVTDEQVVAPFSNYVQLVNNFSQVVSAKHCHRQLGSEFDYAVFDGYGGFNPESLAQISGTLTAGALIVIITPDLDQWQQWSDPELESLWVHPYSVEDVGRLFLRRLRRFLEYERSVIVHSQAEDTGGTVFVIEPAIAITENSYSEQTEVLLLLKEHITHNNHSNSLISADRGRGKSALLGLLAKEVAGELPVFLTAPSKASVMSALAFAGDTLQYFTPDELINQLDNLPSKALLLIDEAAALSNGLLEKLMHKFDHCVFSTTLQGYEGTGQGFNLRFRPKLLAYDSEMKSYSLSQPVRWAAGDPLEDWLNRFLLLRSFDVMPPSSATTLSVEKHSQSDLDGQEGLLSQLFQLLTRAHYRTSPNDLRILLDSPNMHIWLAKKGQTVIAACLIAIEGPIQDDSLAEAIWQGRRRPRGNLLPQILIAQEGLLEASSVRFARVVRIATSAHSRRQQVASKMLAQAQRWCQDQGVDYLGASFSLHQPVLNFWHKNDFNLVRIGNTLESNSGDYNALVLKALQTSEALVTLLRGSFKQRLLFQRKRILPRTNLESSMLDDIALNIDCAAHIPEQWAREQLNAFASHHRSFESVAYLIDKQRACYLDKWKPVALVGNQKNLLVDYFEHQLPLILLYKRHKISGYREFVAKMRLACQIMLDAINTKSDGRE